MNKQELARRIVRDMGYDYQTVRNIIDGIAFEGWLHDPDQVPGRTITESELIAAVDETNHEDMNEYQKARALLVHLGHTVPDPKPPNAEKLEKIIWDLDGPFASIGQNRAERLAKWLDEAGVKAPGGDDER